MADSDNNNDLRNLVSPDVQAMVTVTRLSTEVLTQINVHLGHMRQEMTWLRQYFEGRDGFEKELDAKLSKHLNLLWLKMSASLGAVTGVILLLVKMVEVLTHTKVGP